MSDIPQFPDAPGRVHKPDDSTKGPLEGAEPAINFARTYQLRLYAAAGIVGEQEPGVGESRLYDVHAVYEVARKIRDGTPEKVDDRAQHFLGMAIDAERPEDQRMRALKVACVLADYDQTEPETREGVVQALVNVALEGGGDEDTAWFYLGRLMIRTEDYEGWWRWNLMVHDIEVLRKLVSASGRVLDADDGGGKSRVVTLLSEVTQLTTDPEVHNQGVQVLVRHVNRLREDMGKPAHRRQFSSSFYGDTVDVLWPYKRMHQEDPNVIRAMIGLLGDKLAGNLTFASDLVMGDLCAYLDHADTSVQMAASEQVKRVIRAVGERADMADEEEGVESLSLIRQGVFGEGGSVREKIAVVGLIALDVFGHHSSVRVRTDALRAFEQVVDDVPAGSEVARAAKRIRENRLRYWASRGYGVAE